MCWIFRGGWRRRHLSSNNHYSLTPSSLLCIVGKPRQAPQYLEIVLTSRYHTCVSGLFILLQQWEDITPPSSLVPSLPIRLLTRYPLSSSPFILLTASYKCYSCHPTNLCYNSRFCKYKPFITTKNVIDIGHIHTSENLAQVMANTLIIKNTKVPNHSIQPVWTAWVCKSWLICLVFASLCILCNLSFFMLYWGFLCLSVLYKALSGLTGNFFQ